MESGVPPGDNLSATWFLLSLFLLNYCLKVHETGCILDEITILCKEVAAKGSCTRNKPYSKEIMMFCMTLAGYSYRAYNFVRETFNKCLPAKGTLRTYRNKVDGSPGFSIRPFMMIANKVSELKLSSKNLYLSLSCDDISIRYILQ